MGIIDLIKGFFIAVFVLLLMTAVPMLMFSNTIKSTILQPTFYETQFESANLYVKGQSALLDMFSGMVDANTLSTIGATKLELRSAMAQSITKEWVKSEADRLIKSTLWYLTDQTPGVSLTISIRPKITTGLANLIAPKFGISQADAEQMITTTFTKDLQDPYDLSTLLPGIKQALAQAKSYIGMFMQFSGILLIAIVVLLALIFLLIRDIPKFAATIGWPLLITGILMAAGAYMMPNNVSSMLSQAGVQSSGSLNVQMVLDFLKPVFDDLLLQSIILVVVSVLLVALSFIYPMVVKSAGVDLEPVKRKKK